MEETPIFLCQRTMILSREHQPQELTAAHTIDQFPHLTVQESPSMKRGTEWNRGPGAGAGIQGRLFSHPQELSLPLPWLRLLPV